MPQIVNHMGRNMGEEEIFSTDTPCTCVLRSWPSCLRRSVAFCCRPCRWSCICRREAPFTGVVLEGGGGIRASGADGV